MNPLGYFATSAAIVAVCNKIASALGSRPRTDGLAVDLLDAIGPYLIGAERGGERVWWPAYGF